MKDAKSVIYPFFSLGGRDVAGGLDASLAVVDVARDDSGFEDRSMEQEIVGSGLNRDVLP